MGYPHRHAPELWSGPDPLFPLLVILVAAVVIVAVMRLVRWLPYSPAWFWALVWAALALETIRGIRLAWSGL